MGLAGLLAGGSLEYDLPKLIISVASGEQYRITTVPTTVLSLCERQVLRLLADGLKNEQIAERLSRSYQGVKNVVGHIFQKLHLNSREEAILYYWSVKPSVMDRQ
jgi:DNA-binding NarL/FixJ family response regulator